MAKNKKTFEFLKDSITPEVLAVLLKDHSTDKNIIWATEDYSENGDGYHFKDEITIEKITGEHEDIIKPRVEKSKEEQTRRSRDKAEVFTPSWVCNAQNNLIDKAFIGRKFNTEHKDSWEYEGKSKEVKFPTRNGVTWQEYVKATRMEVSCGEAPYLTSRYDTVTGIFLTPHNRIGLLDRKLRIVGRYTDHFQTWYKWAKIAIENTYGFEWQGDNLLLARENILYTVIEHYYDKFNRTIPEKTLLKFAEIISWNIFQMDGIKFVIPETCHKIKVEKEQTLFEMIAPETEEEEINCPGCEKKDKFAHTGIYARIMDWEENKIIRFVDLMAGGKNYG